MPNRYKQSVLKATKCLVDAVNKGKLDAARSAINQGADINCRIIKIEGEYRIAKDIELRKTASSLMEATDCYGNLSLPTNVAYEVPMVGTTTLLNILALSNTQTRINTLELAEMLMDNGAELGVIDYASYWEGWGNDAANYFQNTPLLNAIAAQNLPFANLYLRFLTKLGQEQRQEILDYKDKFAAGFHTALEFAVRRGFSELATKIVRAGANPNPQPFIFAYAGKSPLHMACMSLGQAWDPSLMEWNSILGSDLELILTLIDHGADFNFTAPTQVYDKVYFNNQYLTIWKDFKLSPFDHIDIAVENITPRCFDIVDSCQEPAFNPKKIGQIKHPFHEEHSFRSSIANVSFRKEYLNSGVFQKRDKAILQKAILKRILKDFSVQFPTSASINEQLVLPIINSMLEHPQVKWFKEQLQYAGIYYNAKKTPRLQLELPIAQNPIATLAVRNKITHCMINDSNALLKEIDQKVAYEACLPETSVNTLTAAVTINEKPPTTTASFLLLVLAHPATKVVAALFIIAGVAGLICGGIGLAGISIGLSLIGATTLTAISVGATGAGIGLGIGGFFYSSRLKQEHQGQDHQTPS